MGQRTGWMQRFLNEDEGLTSIEYALILMLLIVLCLSIIRFLGYGTSVTAENVAHRTNKSAGPAQPYDPDHPPPPEIEIVHSSQPTSFDGVLFVALICTVTACLFTAVCFLAYRYVEWRAQQANRKALHDRTDEEKIETTLEQRLRAGRGLNSVVEGPVPNGGVLNTRVDGPIQDRAVAPIEAPKLVVSNLWWLAPKPNLEARAAANFAPTEGPPIIPPHAETVAAPAKGKVVVFDAGSLAKVAGNGHANGAPGAVATPEPPAGS